MTHHHQKSHFHETPDTNVFNKAFFVGIGLNLLFTIVEFSIGYSSKSLALIADASHNLSDVASLIISLIGLRLSQKAATKFFTYGYKKASILASLINAVLLLFIVIAIIVEAINRLRYTPQIIGNEIIFTALIGIIINTVSAYFFFKGRKNDINIKGAFIHLIADAIVSLGVVISGIIISYTNWYGLDPIISFVIALAIFFSSWKLLKDSLTLILDGVPEYINLAEIETEFLNNPEVSEIHDLHVWAISSRQNALTVHLVLQYGISPDDFAQIKNKIEHGLMQKNIHLTTIEIQYNLQR